jgi:hypothetical protein
MIGYIVSKSLRLILRHWKLHLSFALQMAAGVAAIYACATLYHSAAAQYRDMRAEIDGAVWDVYIAPERPASRPPLDYGQYVRLREAFPGAAFPFCIARAVHYTTDGADIHTAWMLFASDDFLAVVLDADRPGFERGSLAFAGDGVRGLLDGRYRPIQGDMAPERFAGSGPDVGEGGRLSVLPMDELGTGRTRLTHHRLEDVPTDRVALLPLAAYDPLFKPEDAGMFLLSVRFGSGTDGDEAIGAVAEILGLLLEWNGEDYAYSVGTARQRFLLSYGQVRNGAAVAAVIAGLCLAIVLIGLAAVAQLMFLRRRRAFAVSSALGARKGVLFAEMLLESALPSFAGGVAGAAVCSLSLSEFVQSVTIRQSPAIMAAAAAIALAPGCLAACALAFGFRRLRPLEILGRDPSWR